MKQPERNYENLLKITKAISQRALTLKKKRAQTRESARWTPYEAVPMSVPLSELGEREMAAELP